jgi:hypothetical protein
MELYNSAPLQHDSEEKPPNLNRGHLTLTLGAIIHGTASPSLCSAASSVSAFGDDEELTTPKMGAFTGELVIGFDHGIEETVSLPGSVASLGKRDIWLRSQANYA